MDCRNRKNLSKTTEKVFKSPTKRLRRSLRRKGGLEVKENAMVNEENIRKYFGKSVSIQDAAKASPYQDISNKGEASGREKEKFSATDPCTPEFLNSVARCFSSEIEMMQLRLKSSAALNSNDTGEKMIVGKIFMNNEKRVAQYIFEIIRVDLVGWIGAYQRDGMDTPIFHSIRNNCSHISVVCENDYAYKCLEQCIEDIAEMKTMGSVKISRVPAITTVIYCFDVMYECVSHDSDLFLQQLHLHRTELCTNNWVVVSHEVCSQDCKTYFIFLIDERSALALNFRYSRSFCVCLHNVTFRNRGIVPEKCLN